MKKIDYNQMAGDYAANRAPHPEVLKDLAAACSGSKDFKALEIGCGTGNYISAVQELTDAECHGLDPSEQMLKIAAEKSDDLKLVRGDSAGLPFENDFFDLVFSVDVIHHVKSIIDYFGEAARVMRPGGKIATVTDSEAIIKKRLMSKYFPETVPKELARYPSVSTLRVNMKAAGLVDVQEKILEFAYNLTDPEPFRKRAFSALHLITDRALQQGIEKMEADLSKGPIHAVSRYLVLWAKKPG